MSSERDDHEDDHEGDYENDHRSESGDPDGSAAAGDTSTEPVTFDADPGFGGDGGESPGGGENVDATTDRIKAALAEVRREVRKAALVHATVEATLLALVANLVLALVDPSWLAGSLGLPGVVVGALRGLPLLGDVAPRTIRITALAAIAVGLVAFVAAYLVRLRRPLVEQFEAANPPVREALRTARDAVDGGADTEMARRLYDDVIDTLRETSSRELVEARRVAVTVLLVALVSLASIQVAVVDPDLGGILGGTADTPGVDRPDDDELQDGEEILGDEEDVAAGDELENITVPGTGEGTGDGSTAPDGGLGGGGGGSGEFDSQEAGFAGEERFEDAELVREYNVRIRQFDDGEDDGTEGTN
jgi:hypothetical protein